MSQPNRQVSGVRKTAYYAGMTISAIGLLLFLSFFASVISEINAGPRLRFEPPGGSSPFGSAPGRALGGMLLIAAGQATMRVARGGLAGSGIILDPQQARKDIEPWSRMGGGMVDDALSEVGVTRRLEERLASPEPAVKIRCRSCQALNDESAKFCNQCGAAL